MFVVDESGLPKQGKKSAGVSRQYCGAVGKVANCQVGVYLAGVSPKGQLGVDKRLYLPEAGVNDPARCEAARIPENERRPRSKGELALEMLSQAKERGALSARWVTGDDAYGNSPGFRDGVRALGLEAVLEVSKTTPVWPLEPKKRSPVFSGRGRPPQSSWDPAQRQTVEERAAALPPDAWQAIPVDEGAQGPRIYPFARVRGRETRDGAPGEVTWVVFRRNLDRSEPRYYFATAQEREEDDATGEIQAKVSARRGPIETEFRTEKGQVGLDE